MKDANQAWITLIFDGSPIYLPMGDRLLPTAASTICSATNLRVATGWYRNHGLMTKFKTICLLSGEWLWKFEYRKVIVHPRVESCYNIQFLGCSLNSSLLYTQEPIKWLFKMLMIVAFKLSLELTANIYTAMSAKYAIRPQINWCGAYCQLCHNPAAQCLQ
jgi:hypothetical protein